MAEQDSQDVLVYISTFGAEGGNSINLYRLDTSSGVLDFVNKSENADGHFFIAIDSENRFLYSVVFGGKDEGAILAYAIDQETGGLTALNQESVGGPGTCYVSVDKTRKMVIAANYSGGSAASLPVNEDGSLGAMASFFQHEGSSVATDRQQGSHAHCFVIDPGNRYAFANDLGLDKIMIYKLDPENGTMEPNDQAFVRTHPGAGPRHFAFHPSARFAYAVNELDNTMTAFAYDESSGRLTELHHLSTVPDDFDGVSHTADVHVSPCGKFLYGSNRGHDSIACYTIDQESGRISLIGIEPSGGETPQNFAIDPSGQVMLVANQKSGKVTAFQIDGETGKLTPTGNETEIPSPCCIMMHGG